MSSSEYERRMKACFPVKYGPHPSVDVGGVECSACPRVRTEHGNKYCAGDCVYRGYNLTLVPSDYRCKVVETKQVMRAQRAERKRDERNKWTNRALATRAALL